MDLGCGCVRMHVAHTHHHGRKILCLRVQGEAKPSPFAMTEADGLQGSPAAKEAGKGTGSPGKPTTQQQQQQQQQQQHRAGADDDSDDEEGKAKAQVEEEPEPEPVPVGGQGPGPFPPFDTLRSCCGLVGAQRWPSSWLDRLAGSMGGSEHSAGGLLCPHGWQRVKRGGLGGHAGATPLQPACALACKRAGKCAHALPLPCAGPHAGRAGALVHGHR